MVLATPTGFAADASGLTRAMLTWTPGGGDETGIAVQLGVAEDGLFHTVATLGPASTKLEVGGLPANKDIWCRAVATDGAGNFSAPTAAKRVRPSVVEAIRYEMLLPTVGGARRPLPLISHHAIQQPPRNQANGWSPSWQLARITEDSVLFVPTIGIADPEHWDEPNETWEAHAKAMLEWCDENDVPFGIKCYQFEEKFDKAAFGFLSLPPEESPFCLSAADGGDSLLAGNLVDPQGPIGHYTTLGNAFGSTGILEAFQLWCPSPKRWLLVDNNEPRILNPNDALTSHRYVQKYSAEDTLQQRIDRCWADRCERQAAKMTAFRSHLTTPWQEAMVHVGWANNGDRGGLGYYLGGKSYGVWTHTYTNNPTVVLNRADDYHGGMEQGVYNRPDLQRGVDMVSGPQSEVCLWRPQIEEILDRKPDFLFSMAPWPGTTAHITPAEVNPNVFKGHTRYMAWAFREARIWRPYRDANSILTKVEDTFNNPPDGLSNQEYFDRVVELIAEIHGNSTLRRYWEEGTLVPNAASAFPAVLKAFIPAGFPDPDTLWLHHDNSLDPDFATATWTTPVPVQTLVIAAPWTSAPNREWLVLGYATHGDRTGVEISHADWPGGKITVDVPEAGFVGIVHEQNGLLSLPEDSPIATPIGLAIEQGAGSAIDFVYAAPHGEGYTLEVEIAASDSFTGTPTTTAISDTGEFSVDPGAYGARWIKVRRRETASGVASDWSETLTITTEEGQGEDPPIDPVGFAVAQSIVAGRGYLVTWEVELDREPRPFVLLIEKSVDGGDWTFAGCALYVAGAHSVFVIGEFSTVQFRSRTWSPTWVQSQDAVETPVYGSPIPVVGP